MRVCNTATVLIIRRGNVAGLGARIDPTFCAT